MGKPKKSNQEVTEFRPATTPEAREDQLIALAVNLAEQQLRDGTASPSVIAHFLKLGSTKERVERQILEQQKDYLAAKTEAIQSSKHSEELFQEAIAAFKNYSGHGDVE